jgi:hypothetical protein
MSLEERKKIWLRLATHENKLQGTSCRIRAKTLAYMLRYGRIEWVGGGTNDI